MYLLVKTKRFTKSLRKIQKSGNLTKATKKNLEEVLDLLASGSKLPASFSNHNLKGDFLGYQECYIKGDLLLVYKRNKKELILILVDIGSHSYLFK